jgi:hypothetical protein
MNKPILQVCEIIIFECLFSYHNIKSINYDALLNDFSTAGAWAVSYTHLTLPTKA